MVPLSTALFSGIISLTTVLIDIVILGFVCLVADEGFTGNGPTSWSLIGACAFCHTLWAVATGNLALKSLGYADGLSWQDLPEQHQDDFRAYMWSVVKYFLLTTGCLIMALFGTIPSINSWLATATGVYTGSLLFIIASVGALVLLCQLVPMSTFKLTNAIGQWRGFYKTAPAPSS